MFPRKHSPRAPLFSQENRHTPPTLIRGCAYVVTQAVYALEAVEIHLSPTRPISLFGDSLVYGKIVRQTVYTGEGAEINLPL
jgi:hypothetical protein